MDKTNDLYELAEIKVHREKTASGCVVRFVRKPLPVRHEIKPPKFCEGHPGVEYQKSLGGYFVNWPLGDVGRLWHVDGVVHASIESVEKSEGESDV